MGDQYCLRNLERRFPIPYSQRSEALRLCLLVLILHYTHIYLIIRKYNKWMPSKYVESSIAYMGRYTCIILSHNIYRYSNEYDQF